MDIRG
ncbi:hypothetical protein LINGRAHAP2_LOCUS2919 [Linum grandiflorum]